MGLRLCGVDLMIDGDISDASVSFHVLEITSAPGLDHYGKVEMNRKKLSRNYI